MFKNKKNVFTTLSIAGFIAFLIYGWNTGIFSSQSALSNYIAKFGPWAPIVFVGFQVVQVIVPILPGALGCVVGVIAFGPFYGFLYNYVGICVGSILAFLISKKYGRSCLESMFSEKTYGKYLGWLNKGKKFDWFFAGAIFLPIAPDDLLCYIAGLTKMTFLKFTCIIILCKPASIYLYSMGITNLGKIILQFAKNVG